MALWILTIGNNDVQLNYERVEQHKKWGAFFRKVKPQLDDLGNVEFEPKVTEHANCDKTYTIAARVLGMVYEQQLQHYYDDLVFPLLNSFSCRLKTKEHKIKRIICLLTNQENVFNLENREISQCPFWQDTITLKPILETYFEHHFPQIEPEYISLQPNEDIGLDDWNSVLTLVHKELSTISVDDNETIYVSHQAGTPAISSAVQFTSLSRFGKQVQFLVSNEFDLQPASIIEGSTYLQGIQLQQAKQLIKSGSPGAAQELLNVSKIEIDNDIKHELNELVNIFNINNSSDSEDDFEVAVAIKRVIRALDLIQKYFEQKNYIQGITLLAAAHEAFIKAGIIYFLDKRNPIDKNKFNFAATEVLQWQNQGLMFLDDFIYNIDMQEERKKLNEVRKKINQLFGIKIDRYNKNNSEQKKAALEKADKERLTKKIEVLRLLQFPVEGKRNDNDKDLNLIYKLNNGELYNLKCVNDKNAQYRWLIKLSNSKLKSWDLLKWFGQYKREFEDDKRNQIMHNLRGIEEKDVIKYLKGLDNSEYQDSKNSQQNSVIEVYQAEVKDKFIQAIKDLGLFEEEKPNLQERLDKLARELSQ
ncbi:MAG: hypothetical protein QNJ55_22930 [Xenococcus sp. MO_188.B8]|nr:hypothetical protein [Xenococcus sp. MO_188.B8]